MTDKILKMIPRFLQVCLLSVSFWLVWKSFHYFYPFESIGMIIIVVPTFFLSLFFSIWHDVLHDKEWIQHARKFPDYD